MNNILDIENPFDLTTKWIYCSDRLPTIKESEFLLQVYYRVLATDQEEQCLAVFYPDNEKDKWWKITRTQQYSSWIFDEIICWRIVEGNRGIKI